MAICDRWRYKKEVNMLFRIICRAILILFATTWTMGLEAVGAELIAHWPLDQDAGDEVKDVIGERHGVMKGGKAVWVAGKFNNGLQIQGPNQYVEVPKSKDLELERVTLIAWVNLKSTAGRQEVASYADSYGIFADGGFFRALLFNGGGWNVVNGVTPVKADAWYQVAQTVDKNKIQLYVNGKLDAELATPPIAYQNFPLWFGGGPADNSFWLTGVLDDIEIWNDVLSEAKITELFNSPPVLAVEPTADKLTTTWGALKSRR
jgi:hypothetical protein